ncbi:UDP-N-acetylmuramoyl-L-alanyl-D-glutamate--2,6-diaminopimelate ligase [Marinobacter salexigens]|uniref:UDP-N-acetylmuramoyl-L-alanyl-D-glutamate--2, 6-diaminopimelate ligase n=1 Tax=Marinobacter salexigens TaxID=1925763 RepID=UPI000C29237A|nr:UDP-N-acetylmuramoyl-L-alanyl-D-glutamate--2,6-diaminopimelate ligase [Marinobacter salexigens]
MSMTSLSTLLQGIVPVPSVFDVTIHDLRADSRAVRSGDAFVALSGADTPADQYVDKAVDAGATVVLLESEEAGECREHRGALIVPVVQLRQLLGKIAARFYEHPSRRLRLIGVTGTNGKTSVSHYIAQLLGQAGTPCGILGTLGYGMPGALQEASHTTPDAVQINRALSDILSMGGRAAAMEVSSHGLDQGRVDGLAITGAVFTNLTRDHLDYHGSMEAYGATKARLFEREDVHFSVINFDDPFGRQLYEMIEGKCDRIRYSLHESELELWLKEFHPTDDGFDAVVDGEWGLFGLSVPLMGSFNASNVLAAVAAAMTVGATVEQVQEAVRKLAPPPGRLEQFRGVEGVRAVVDYAHTPDALSNALAALRPHVTGKLICVFGCGGDRDSGKRPEMAREAENCADFVIVTDDNPRTENPVKIVQDILAGFSRPNAATVIHDRAEAIRFAIDMAGPNDLVLVAGKGHEAWQEIAGQKFPFSDAAHVCQGLKIEGGAL